MQGPKTWGPNQNPVPDYIFIFRRFEKFGPVGPQSQNRGVIWKIGAQCPRAPLSFEPWKCIFTYISNLLQLYLYIHDFKLFDLSFYLSIKRDPLNINSYRSNSKAQNPSERKNESECFVHSPSITRACSNIRYRCTKNLSLGLALA